MRLIQPATILFTTLLANTANADFIGANVEFGTFSPETNFSTTSSSDFDYKGESGTYFSADIQHPIPLIPNARLDIWNYKTTGTSGVTSSTLKVSSKDVTGYYGIGLLWIGVEGGITIRDIQIDYSETSTNYSVNNSFLPIVYLSAKARIPGTEIRFAVESKESIALDALSDIGLIDESTDKVADLIYKVSYQPIPIIGVEVGYIDSTQTIDNATLENSGYFLGVTIDI